jgi:hypothetical protein
MRGLPATEREAELELATADAHDRRARRAATGEAPGCGGQARPADLDGGSGGDPRRVRRG